MYDRFRGPRQINCPVDALMNDERAVLSRIKSILFTCSQLVATRIMYKLFHASYHFSVHMYIN